MQEIKILKKIFLLSFLIITILPNIASSDARSIASIAKVSIEQNQNNFDITITAINDAYILEDTLDINIVGDSASLNSVFYKDSESFDNHNVFWNKTNIKVIVDSKSDKKFIIQVVYQICSNLHVCSELKTFEQSFKISKPIEKITSTVEDNKQEKVVTSNHASLVDRKDLCAKQGICPKIDELAELFNSKVENSLSNTVLNIEKNQEAVSEQDSIVNMLKSSSLLFTLVTFFGFGLLLAFTPCMLPVIPILSAVIISKKENISTREGFLLSLTYVISMSIVYAVAGVAAASLGSNIQAFFQQTWIIILFSAFFFILSLAMFGTFSLEMPTNIQSFLNRKAISGKGITSYYSVVFLGVLSALIVGPCVAPPLAGALIYIGQNGNEFIGGLSLFLMSFGMGVPLLLLGSGAGKFLPKPGPWMVDVKLFFGFAMIAFSIWILSRILDAQVILLLWGVLLAAIAVFMSIFENKACTYIDSIYHLKKLIALLVLMYGMMLIVGAIAGAKNVRDPLEPFKAKEVYSKIPSRVVFETISSVQIDDVVKQASGPIMIAFTAQWCDNCKEFENNVFSEADVAQELEKFDRFRVDITANTDTDRALLKKYSLFGPPGVIFFDINKKELKNYRLSGYKEKKLFIEHIQKVKSAL